MVNGFAGAVRESVDNAIETLGFNEIEALENAQLRSPACGREGVLCLFDPLFRRNELGQGANTSFR